MSPGSVSTKTTAIKMVRPVRGKVRRRSPKSKMNGADNSEDSHSHHSESSADDESHSSLVSMVLLHFIPVTALIVQNSTQLSTVVTNLREAGETKLQIVMVAEIGKLLAELQQERAEFGFCLFTNSTSSQLPRAYFQSTSSAANSRNSRSREGIFSPSHDPVRETFSVPPTPPEELLNSGRVSTCRTSLSTRFERTDNIIRNLTDYVATYVPSVISIRSELKGATDDTTLDELIWYNVANDAILELLNQRIRKTKSTGVWKPLIAYMNVIRAIENYSISMVYGLYYFGKGSLSQNSYNKYVTYDSLAADYLNSTKSYSPEINSAWERYIGQAWRSKGFESAFQSLEDRGEVVEEIRSATAKQAVAAFLLTIVLSISPILLILIRKITGTIQMYSMDLSTKTAALRREKRRSDKLLNQMLPLEVIKQLKKNRQVPAENFESCTIYFSDIVSFTKLSSSSSPMEIIVMLNSLYKLFDSKIELYDVYKVETIGDAYMALDLIAGVQQFQIPHRPGVPLQIRVGINSGPCVAGVVGTTMPRYCLFGDSINVASRMESHGEAMKIHVTQNTKIILDELGEYILEPRGSLDIKGKGTMSTYWLLDKVGGLTKKEVELSIPGFLKTSKDNLPEFMHDIFGSGSDDSEEGLKVPHFGTTKIQPTLVQPTASRVPIGLRH
ncbi:Atrial natriuretic peptide receptor 1 [Folsomia candida]|uniref:Atrial natriuretic peptide receptor 1 n=1 Tax=Folsomia candida TaxID=158441 RepID=A0A226EPN3_FOLCA|nr:Atrial natriuretic peptide receptor 1 [Folsomia candida]